MFLANLSEFTFCKFWPNLWDVFGGDLKVQFAIDVDFPGVSTLIIISRNLADLSASLLGK